MDSKKIAKRRGRGTGHRRVDLAPSIEFVHEHLSETLCDEV